ncbi:MAG: hypothetical protein KGJ57_17415 [Sphingomonadales bacterium]|nr:hypothetical protein [Sphingomonadales bacterium]MDE2171177.1 hypothetical protein [Sphingomonadales bacterium]
MTVLSGKPTFGAGRAFMTGNYTNPTPARALVPQSQSIDFKRKVESLFGEKQFAAAVGAGEMEVTGKVEYGKTNARIYSDILFGASSTTGSYLEADKEAATIPGTSTYVVTVANATNFIYDLGVTNATTGAIMTCVAAGSEVAGTSYSVATSGANKGKYTFAAGDANGNVLISYVWQQSAVGESIVMANQLQGLTGNFQAVHTLPWGTEQDMFVFFNCIASSGSLSAKKSGFGTSSLDYMAAVNGNDQLGVATFAEAA